MSSIIVDLYNDQINLEIKTVFDIGFMVKIGDSYNGFAAQGSFDTWAEALHWLKASIIELYPDSDSAKKYKLEN